jgi:hypothetical protein
VLAELTLPHRAHVDSQPLPLSLACEKPVPPLPWALAGLV